MADDQSSNSAADAADAQNQLLDNQSDNGSSSSERGKPTSLWAKFTAEHLIGDCPYKVALDTIDTSLWGIPALPDSSERHATTWVAKTIHDYNIAIV